MKVAAYQCPLLPSGSMDAIECAPRPTPASARSLSTCWSFPRRSGSVRRQPRISAGLDRDSIPEHAVIVWLASYPRSGNTFLRIVLHRVYGVPTYSVYQDDDPVAQRVGPALVGYRPRPADRAIMAGDAEVYFVKTHKRRKADGYPAICLVRDGRDAVVSAARLRATAGPAPGDDRALFEQLLREEITRPYVAGQPSSGGWGGNVLSWVDSGGTPLAILRYEDLVVDPRGATARAVLSLLPDLVPVVDACIPSFDELHGIDPEFFRRGVARSCRDEMPDELHELFWAQPANAVAMRRLGYV